MSIQRAVARTQMCIRDRTMDDILCDARKREALRYVDILVDGEFVSALQGEEPLFRGSSNQRFIDVQKSLSTNQVVEVRPEKI